MTELDDIEALAAEYVLGTLSREERRDVAARREKEPRLDAAIAAWERRLGPLAEVVASGCAAAEPLQQDPRADRPFRACRLAQGARADARRAAPTAGAGRRVGMTALAASLAGVVGWQEYQRQQMPTQYVAVLQAGESTPAFLLTVDTKTNMFVDLGRCGAEEAREELSGVARQR